MELNSHEQAILKYLKKVDRISVSSLAKNLKIHFYMMELLIKKLIDAKLITLETQGLKPYRYVKLR